MIYVVDFVGFNGPIRIDDPIIVDLEFVNKPVHYMAINHAFPDLTLSVLFRYLEFNAFRPIVKVPENLDIQRVQKDIGITILFLTNRESVVFMIQEPILLIIIFENLFYRPLCQQNR